MPSKTAKQARFMAAAAHNASFAKSAGIPQKVAKEFNQADAGKTKWTPNSVAFKSKRLAKNQRSSVK